MGGVTGRRCEADGCDELAPFGFDVRSRNGKVGRWFCAAHRHLGDRRDVKPMRKPIVAPRAKPPPEPPPRRTPTPQPKRNDVQPQGSLF